jgi:hypothetical protein
LRAANVNGKLKSQDGLASAGFVENIPILLDKHFGFAASKNFNIGASNLQVFAEFGHVSVTIPEVDVHMS